MSLQVITGAEPTGTAIALRLAGQGQTVRLISRAGTGPAAAGAGGLTADATGTAQLAALAEGAAVPCSCASPPYHRWPHDWPPLATSVLSAAGRTVRGGLHRLPGHLRRPARTHGSGTHRHRHLVARPGPHRGR